jgi:hypothetical protein
MALDVDTTNLDINIIVKSNLPIDSVTWTLGDGTSGNTNPILHTYDSAGTYRVCIKIFSDCTSKDTCFNLTVKDIKSGIYHFEKMPFSVFPNPANDVININGLQKTYNLQLTNTLGQRFINRTSNKNHEVLDISSLSAGHYLLLVSDITEGTIYKVNIIKQQ